MLPRSVILVLLSLTSAVAEPPHLVRSGQRVDLIVDGKPWLILGGELRNSSSSTLEFMRPVWPHLEALNLNTVFTPVSWKQLQPRRGEFDFTLLDGLISSARARNLRLILLWMGAWKNGVSGCAPEWIITDPPSYPRISPTALSPSMRGFYRDGDEKGETFDFNGYRAFVTYRPVPREKDRFGSFGLIIQTQTAPGEFFVAGRGISVRFADAGAAGRTLVNLGVEEGDFVAGRWRVRRYLNGDEVGGQGAEAVLTPAPFSNQPVIGEEKITILSLRIARL